MRRSAAAAAALRAFVPRLPVALLPLVALFGPAAGPVGPVSGPPGLLTGPSDTCGGGGGSGAPATKQFFFAGAPGIWAIAFSAMFTSALDNLAYRSCGAITCPWLIA